VLVRSKSVSAFFHITSMILPISNNTTRYANVQTLCYHEKTRQANMGYPGERVPDIRPCIGFLWKGVITNVWIHIVKHNGSVVPKVHEHRDKKRITIDVYGLNLVQIFGIPHRGSEGSLGSFGSCDYFDGFDSNADYWMSSLITFMRYWDSFFLLFKIKSLSIQFWNRLDNYRRRMLLSG
jgi:hypothetical protein